MIVIDGSEGEGGGQIIRTALALSVVTRRPFRIVNVRGRRKRPGLLRQHLTAVRAASRIGMARVEGDQLGSPTLTFEPSGIASGHYEFDIGSAGSANLVLQTVLPPLLRADGPSSVTVAGGTHNPKAPTFEFLERSYLPLVRKMGVEAHITLERYGFYPRGGGRLRIQITPGPLGRLELTTPGPWTRRRAVVSLADLPAHIAARELSTLERLLELTKLEQRVETLPAGCGPGNVARVELSSDAVTLVFTELGKRGVPAESVAERLAKQVKRVERAEVAVDEHLADQLLLPMALGEGGVFTTVAPTEHTRTHARVIELFLDRETALHEEAPDRWRISL